MSILVDLKKHGVSAFLTFQHGFLSVRKNHVKSTFGGRPHDSHRGLAEVFGADFGGGQAAVEVSLHAGFSGAERALFPGFRSADRTTH